ncbi:HisA/HisF-related TIM barrel protein [Methylomonas sp. LWB]|uniref:HisA/HisF-related TIM barrel protein n=1 Tax=Methylomonas sp. LWB TaxID=1905845 RepID=UPI0020C8F3D7|nr:HisA/HisF-related TIM barrel protein [Methylomonas sp. LWB]
MVGAMQVIPVIDLKDGEVVLAAGGDRSRYRPVHPQSSICEASEPIAVVEAFLNLHAFTTFYIADLDAIEARGSHRREILKLAETFPDLTFWIDDGGPAVAIPSRGNLRPVVGTESQRQAFDLSGGSAILSLDFKHQRALGDPGWQRFTNYWPETVIAMTLDKVGGHGGPDCALLSELQIRHPNRCFVAAGGVRNRDDLRRLAEIGVRAALVASALHSGALTGKDLENL